MGHRADVPLSLGVLALRRWPAGGASPGERAAPPARANAVAPEAWPLAIATGLIGFGALLTMASPSTGCRRKPAFAATCRAQSSGVTEWPPAVLVNGAMFGLLHFPNHPNAVLPMLPYYIAVSSLYSSLTWATNSILPALARFTPEATCGP